LVLCSGVGFGWKAALRRSHGKRKGCAGDARFNPDNIIIGSRQANIIAITKFS
jgi:hypothetical protein